MKSVIIKPKNEILKKYIQYFLFFKKTDNHILHYTTFPNNNLCLAIYKQNEVSYVNNLKTNNCIISKGNNLFPCRFYGFHKMPFNVQVDTALDQICIVFYPSAIKAFTFIDFNDLMNPALTLKDIFTYKHTFSFEQVFEQENLFARAEQLEHILFKNLRDDIPDKLKEALYIISAKKSAENLNIESLSKQLKISDTTLFRLFKNHLGQNPKSYLQTIRFRNVLHQVANPINSLTEIAYQNQYYDQAHFIKDFKTFSGYAPKQLAHKISVQQNDLTWIYNKN
ncbi:helix-turn-helix domain-containing protein [Pedobacter sp.]|uniref:helix-turn-helix domain-containing protein n=1 Tax=Pedobacter sp. TaxID=1411316 RepID=UPI00396C68B7